MLERPFLIGEVLLGPIKYNSLEDMASVHFFVYFDPLIKCDYSTLNNFLSEKMIFSNTYNAGGIVGSEIVSKFIFCYMAYRLARYASFSCYFYHGNQCISLYSFFDYHAILGSIYNRPSSWPSSLNYLIVFKTISRRIPNSNSISNYHFS